MLDTLLGSGWMMKRFEWAVCVYRIDRKMFSKGLKWLVIGRFMVSVGFVVLGTYVASSG